MIKIAVFVEGEFDRVTEYPTKVEAYAYASGLSSGAGAYSGDLQAYVLPEQTDEMEEQEKLVALAALYAHLRETK